MLETYLRDRLKKKDVLLMTHIVLGYPSIEDSLKIIEAMVDAGVDLMELQIPFSEPIADGPVILHANQQALARGVTVQKCMDVAQEAARAFDIPFLFMTYYNILFKYGVDRFAQDMQKRAIQGAIIPDLPPEEGKQYIETMREHALSPIFIFSPTTSDSRMRYLASFAHGFVYCVARKGVTGSQTEFSRDLSTYLGRCRQATSLPLALGFGVKNKRDIDYLKGKAEIAVVGSQTLRLIDEQGVGAVGEFIRSLRE